MRIYLSQPCYKWLVQLKILKAYIVQQQSLSQVYVQQQQSTTVSQNQRRYQLCYDDQIYLQNGYLVGVLMRQILKAHQLYSDKLLKIRKITVLKKDENWAIIRQVLGFLDYPFYEWNEELQQQYQPDLKEIQRILQFLYNDYGPFASRRKDKNHRYYHLEPWIIHANYEKNRLNSHLDGISPYSFPHCNNLLQYTCFIIHKSFNFNLRIDECMGLLIDKGKFLKKLIINGLSTNKHSQPNHEHDPSRFTQVQTLYHQLLNSTSRFDQLLAFQPSHIEHFMEIFASGVLSKSGDIAKLTCLLIESVEDQGWFVKYGVRIMVKSQWPEVMNLIIDKARGCFRQVFNQQLQQIFVYEEDFLTFLIKFLPILARSMYSKQVLQSFTIPYLLQKATAPFDPDDISSSQPKIRHLSRQVLAILFKHFYKKIPEIQRTYACIAFDLHPHYGLKMSFWETFALLGNLFELIKVFLVNEDATVEKYFRIALRYLRAKEMDVKEMVIENLKELYFTMRKSFPLGAYLTCYEDIVALNPIISKKDCKKTTTNQSLSPIAQHFDFDFLMAISKDQSLVEQEVLKTLNIALEYFLQINGDCFLQVILNLLKFKESSEWCVSISEQILGKWTEIKLPPLMSNAYNRKSPQEMCRFEAFGVKRKEILKFQEYQKYKLLLQAICQLKDGGFLREYGQKVHKKVQQINRNKDLSAYNIFLKKLLQKIRLNKTLLLEPVELASKSLIYLSQGMGRNDTIAHGLEQLTEEDEIKSQALNDYDDGLDKLRDQVHESPIHRNITYGLGAQSRKDNLLGENDGGIDDELNEFLQTKNKALKDKNGISTSGGPIINEPEPSTNQSLFQKHLKPHTQQQPKPTPQPEDIFIHHDQLQQFQLTYIKVQRQNNSSLVEASTKAYFQSFKGHQTDQSRCLVKFLTSLNLHRHLPQKEALMLWKKAQDVHGEMIHNHQGSAGLSQDTARQIVWELLVQYSFLMFGFKRNTRTRVKLIQIFLKLLANNLNQNKLITIKTLPQSRPQTIMKRQMTFENQLISNKLLKWNPQYNNQYLKGQLIPPKNLLKNKLSESKQQTVSRILESHQISPSGERSTEQKPKYEMKEQKPKHEMKEQRPKYEMKEVHHNCLEPWLVCFEILNDILALPAKQKSLGLGLIEPISKITTSVLPEPNLNKQRTNQNKSSKNPNQQNAQMNDQQIQLNFLQEQLQRLQNSSLKAKSPSLQKSQKTTSNQQPYNKKSQKITSNQFSQNKKSHQITPNQQSQRSQTSKAKTRPPRLEYSVKNEQRVPNVSFSRITASQLQDKIKSRKDQLKQQIKKKSIVPQPTGQSQHEKPQQSLQNHKISYNADA